MHMTVNMTMQRRRPLTQHITQQHPTGRTWMQTSQQQAPCSIDRGLTAHATAMLAAVVSTAPTMGLPPKWGPSGLALSRRCWYLYTEYANAPARGNDWSEENRALRVKKEEEQGRYQCKKGVAARVHMTAALARLLRDSGLHRKQTTTARVLRTLPQPSPATAASPMPSMSQACWPAPHATLAVPLPCCMQQQVGSRS